jgi:oligoribonuclease
MDKKIANAKTNRILWVDLEMTGLDANNDLILEIAAIVTDWDFTEIATYEGVVQHDNAKLLEYLAKNEFWESNLASRDGLIAQNKDGKSLEEIQTEILNFIAEHFEADKPVLLAGNSIHMDRRFITAQWPLFDAKLHYRMLDVSAWKVVFDGKYGKRFAKPEEHRALGDIRGSISELQYYLGKVKV